MARKYTRKHLKQPDEFISASGRVVEWSLARVRGLVITSAVALAAIGAMWAWTNYSEGQAEKATSALTEAIDVYNGTVAPEADGKPGDDGIPRFKTRKAKLAAAEKRLDAVVKSHSGTAPARFARLLRAGVRLDRSDIKSAIEDYEAVLESGEEDAALRFVATEGLAYAYEAQKQWDKALAEFKKLPRKGEVEYVSLYHEAHMLAKKGKSKEAVKIYKRIQEKAGSRSLVSRVGERLAMLQKK